MKLLSLWILIRLFIYKLLFLLINIWSPGPDLNRHARNERGILSPLCLPISPPGGEFERAIIARQLTDARQTNSVKVDFYKNNQ